jgi:hypothetical protein
MKTVREEFEELFYVGNHLKWDGKMYINTAGDDNTQRQAIELNECFRGFTKGIDYGLTTAQAKHEAEIGELLNKLDARKQEIEADERYHYPDANMKTNAYLAIIQIEFKTEIALINRLLAPYKKTTVPCEECGGRGEIGGIMPDCPGGDQEPCPSCQGKGTVER